MQRQLDFWKPSIFGRENAAAPLTLLPESNIGESAKTFPTPNAPDTSVLGSCS